MHESISSRTRSVSPDRPQGRGLCVVPIVGTSHKEPEYELLREQTIAKVKVTEISSVGSVPDLRVENELDVRVFLMDGQELVGAKQNRVLNTDVMVPAKSSVMIPVSCVEQGRWRHTSAHFTPGKSASHRTRSAKMARVHASLKTSGMHDADQGAVWEEVAGVMAMANASSATAALSDVYRAKEKELSDFRRGLQMPEEAVGLAVLHEGKLQGIDLFDRHSTLVYFWESLLDSYAIEFLSAPVEPGKAEQSDQGRLIREALDRAAGGNWERFGSPGEGIDWRLEDERFAGAALVWEEKVVVHAQLFPRATDSTAVVGRGYRPRIRRRFGESTQ